MSVTGAKLIGAGLATIGLSGPGVGAGIFSSFSGIFHNTYFRFFILVLLSIFSNFGLFCEGTELDFPSADISNPLFISSTIIVGGVIFVVFIIKYFFHKEKDPIFPISKAEDIQFPHSSSDTVYEDKNGKLVKIHKDLDSSSSDTEIDKSCPTLLKQDMPDMVEDHSFINNVIFMIISLFK
jgi:magnesium-transporting ATPase (P-type)